MALPKSRKTSVVYMLCSNRHLWCHLYIEPTDSMIYKLKVSHFVHIDSTALDGLRPLIKLVRGLCKDLKNRQRDVPTHRSIMRDLLTLIPIMLYTVFRRLINANKT